MDILSQFMILLDILPTPPEGTPSELAQNGITFFATWIERCGGLIAFIGAVKLALSIKDDNTKEQMLAILVMVSGFMIKAAVGDLNIFNIPKTYTEAAANAEFQSILKFIGKWTRRVGAFGMFMGAASLGLSMKNHDAGQKVLALRAIASGGIVVAISAILHTFV